MVKWKELKKRGMKTVNRISGYRKKTFVFLAVFFLLFSVIFPSVSWGESTNTSSSDYSLREILQTSEWDPPINSEISSTISSRQESTHLSEATKATDETQASEGTQEIKKNERALDKNTKASNLLNDRVEITEWGIYDDANNRLSPSNAAVSDESYTLKFNWKISDLQTNRIQQGDYFILSLPQNEGTLPDKSDANGHWTTNNSGQTTPIMGKVGNEEIKIGEWFIENHQIRVQFTSGISQITATEISGTDFNIGNGALKNYTVKAGIQNVAFGNNVQQIYFNAREVVRSNGYSFKNAAVSGNNAVTYTMPVNIPTSVELGGDIFDHSVNHETGWYYDAANPQNGWGRNATDVEGIYVEDELDAGATLGTISITADTRIPMLLPFTEQTPYDGTKHEGGLVSRDPAFASYVLYDSGNGPEYRTAATNELYQKPSQATSFDRVVQENGESKEVFRARIKARDYQYGTYYDETSDKYTVMVYFGDVSSENTENNKLKKYSDLTDEKYAPSGRLVKGTNTPVLNFAVKTADYLIKNGFYTEADRELIEDYFTMTYGDSNYLGGQAASYNISMLVRYPPEAASGEKSNTVSFYQDSEKVVAESNPQERSVTTWLNNPYSSIQLSADQAVMFKFDENKQAMANVRFGLQEKVSGTWKTVEGKDYTTGVIKVPVKVVDNKGNETIEQQDLDGGIVTGSLPAGTYRFVELENPEGYDEKLSPDYDSSEGKIVSQPFTLPTEGNAPIRYITNVSAPKYTVLHYVQKNSGSTEHQSDFELRLQETLKGNKDETVIGKERTFSGYSYMPGHSLEVKTGEVKEDGSLTLKLYYKTDTSVSPFSINKLGMNNNPMPSYSKDGDSLGPDKTVKFDVYVVKNWRTGEIDTTHPEEEDGIYPSNRIWERLEIDGTPVTLTTDAEGKLRDSRISLISDWDENGDVKNTRTFALVEKQTYKGYELPDEESGEKNTYWVVYTKATADKKAAEISWVEGVGLNGATNPGTVNNSESGEFALLNKRKEGAGWWLYKETFPNGEGVNENAPGTPMPSLDTGGNPLEEKVTFQLYKYIGGWNSAANDWNYSPKEYDPTDERAWQVVEGYTYTTDHDGLIVGDHAIPVDGNVYALVETSTYSTYHCPSPRQAYWVLWSDGNISSCGTDNFGTRYISTYSYALRNGTATNTVLYKADTATKEAMGSDEKQQVAFRYYKYIGKWIAGIEGPTLNTNLTDTTNWVPLVNPDYELSDPSSDKFLFKTDEQGRLSKINEMFTSGFWDTTYAVQEVQTYPGYKLNKANYWVIYMKHKIQTDRTTPLVVSDVGYVSSGWPILKPTDIGNPFKEFVLLNEAYQYPTFRFIKENEKRDPLGNVSFELYAGKENGVWGIDSTDPDADDSYWAVDQPYRKATSSLSGEVALDRLEPGRYLLVETHTAEGYQLPQGEWIITVTEENGNVEITDIRARDGTSPPAFRLENGNYYLPNYLKNSLPRAGGYLRVFLAVLGIVLLGSVVLLLQNRTTKKTDDEKGKENEKIK